MHIVIVLGGLPTVTGFECKFSSFYLFFFSLSLLANLIDASSDGIEIISLRNPCTEKSTKYLYAKQKQPQFYEILCFNEEPRSWFANDFIYPNGNIYMTAPFDPVFFALYYIRTHNVDKCQPIEQTIIDDNFSKAYLIADALAVDQLALVSKQKIMIIFIG